MAETSPFQSEVLHESSADGSFHSLVLKGSKGNILDGVMCRQLILKLDEIAENTSAKILVLSGDGGTFSYGASVQEHFPDQVPEMLENMRRVITMLSSFPVPTLAAVEGRCLGGGLEVALACGMVFVDERAVLAFPEIRLGAFAPFGTALLHARIPDAIAEELLLTGREFGAVEAARWGLANRVVPYGRMEDEVVEFAGTRLLPFSAASLRVATHAIRALRAGAVPGDPYEAMAKIYREELVPLEDAREGIRAFLEKRYPGWQNR